MSKPEPTLHFDEKAYAAPIVSTAGGGVSVINPKYADLARHVRAKREERRTRRGGI